MGAACAKCSACYEAFWTHIENGDFERWAHFLGILTSVLLVAVPILKCIPWGWTGDPPFVTFIMMILLGVFTGILEFPFCFTCFQCCRTLDTYLKRIAQNWARFLFYVAEAAILIVVQMHSRDEKSDPNVTGWSFSVLLCVNAVMYALAVLSPKPKEDVEMATHKPPEEQDAGAATTSRANARAEEEARKAAASGAGMAGGLAGALMRNEAVQNAAASAAKDPAVQKAAFNAVKDNPSLAVEAMRAARKV